MLNTLSLGWQMPGLFIEQESVNDSIEPGDIARAIRNDELYLQYQPRYNADSGKAFIMEALVRWQHPVRGQVQPDRFIAVAEEHGLICQLGLWVFEQSCKDLVNFRSQLRRKIKIAVNVSLLQCEDTLHAPRMYDICQKYNLDLSDFEFELTESECIRHKSRVLGFCETLKKMGAEISLDDFGTSYSPLNNLSELPINCIKIDKSFVKRIEGGSRDEVIIRHLVELAHELDIKVVAEGVEFAYQRDYLTELGCDQLQGFFMCRPVSPENISGKNMDMCLA